MFDNRTALKRTTFGVRESELALVNQQGWAAWVEDQLDFPSGDDPDLQVYLASQEMRITYEGVDEFRPLTLLDADRQEINDLVLSDPIAVNEQERARLFREALVATAIRAIHSRYQLREVLVDFWRNHFSIPLVSSAIAYEREVLRPNALGNFAEFVEATAASPEMLAFLNNQDSRADKPNENYARELLELHTMGAEAYRGVTNADSAAPPQGFIGFTDEDIVNGAKALSGWTINYSTGAFRYEPQFHNETAQQFLGQPVGHIQGIEQGEFVINRAATSSDASQFICRKLTEYLIGTPALQVINRAVAVWNANRTSPNQIEQVVREILLSGDEIGDASLGRVRRPLEQVFGLHRAIETAFRTQEQDSDFNMYRHLDTIRDRPFGWTTPEGRPLTDQYALSTSGVHAAYLTKIEQLFDTAHFRVSLQDQTPVTTSVMEVLEFWVTRLIGDDLSERSNSAVLDWSMRSGGLASMLMNLGAYVSNPDGLYNLNDFSSAYERELRRLVLLISNTPEFLRR